jgi:CO/xanthine dehydrogenase Mo-binding subunit
MSSVGKNVLRVDAVGKVTGQAQYPGDINLPDQAYMKILFSDRPHALIKSIDITEAESLPGVLAIFTARDVPNNEYGLISKDQPVLCGPDSSNPYANRVLTVADQIALIIAESENIAFKALKLIRVSYEDLPIITSPLEAISGEAIILHPDRDSNIFCKYRIRKGDWEDAFNKAETVIEDEYFTPAQEHAYLQPEAGVGYIDDAGRVTVIVGGQWAHDDQEQIAHSLGLPHDQVRVIYPAIGGAFGGREDMSIQIVLGLAAWRLHQKGINRPVKIIWSREESIIGHHKRHPYIVRVKLAASNDGKITAAQAEIIADGGAYMYTSTKVLGNATLLVTGPYQIPNVRVDSMAVYTNNLPNGAFRGFGGPQACFAIESSINKLAEKIGMDPVEFRMRNLIKEGDLLSVGTPLPKGVTIQPVLERCAKAAGWKKSKKGWDYPGSRVISDPKRPHILGGIGISCGYKNVGFSYGAPERCTATIEIHGGSEIEKVILRHAGAEVGQGSHTAFAQMTADALNVPFEKVHLIVSDTAETKNSGSVSASRMTFMAGNSIRGAAALALERWNAEERPAIATYEYRPPRTTPFDPETGKSEPNFAYGYVAEAVVAEIDMETGQILLKKIICVDDVGLAVNPQQVEGQIEGALVQAAGYAILENFIQKDGFVVTKTLSTYLIPTVLDIPEVVEPIILQYPDPIGPFGARGMGEMPYLPLVPAIIDAVHSATGIWFDDFPLIPERVFRGIHD